MAKSTKKPIKKTAKKVVKNVAKKFTSKEVALNKGTEELKDVFVVEGKLNPKDLSNIMVNDINVKEDRVMFFEDSSIGFVGLSSEQSKINIESLLQDYKNWEYKVNYPSPGDSPISKEDFYKSLAEKYTVAINKNK